MFKHIIFDKTTGELRAEDIPAHLKHLEGKALMEALVHDCPECNAARLAKPVRRPDIIRSRRPRWRHLKRSAGR